MSHLTPLHTVLLAVLVAAALTVLLLVFTTAQGERTERSGLAATSPELLPVDVPDTCLAAASQVAAAVADRSTELAEVTFADLLDPDHQANTALDELAAERDTAYGTVADVCDREQLAAAQLAYAPALPTPSTAALAVAADLTVSSANTLGILEPALVDAREFEDGLDDEAIRAAADAPCAYVDRGAEFSPPDSDQCRVTVPVAVAVDRPAGSCADITDQLAGNITATLTALDQLETDESATVARILNPDAGVEPRFDYPDAYDPAVIEQQVVELGCDDQLYLDLFDQLPTISTKGLLATLYRAETALSLSFAVTPDAPAPAGPPANTELPEDLNDELEALLDQLESD